jgi:SOS-response transcriptional repressor LexA
MNDAIASRLREAREQRGYKTAREAAEAMGVVYSTYSGHERYGKIRTAELERYAKFFGVSIDWLLSEKGLTKPSGRSIPEAPPSAPPKQLPHYKVNQLTIFEQIRDNAIPEMSVEFLAMPNDTPDTAFALTILDRSMVQMASPSLPPGTLIIVVPDAQIHPGDIVCAVVKGFQEFLIRQFGRTRSGDSTHIVLTPFNPSYETVTFTPDRENYIVGRVRTPIVQL